MIVLAAHGIAGSRGDEPWTMTLEETPSGRVVETGEPIVSRQVADRADLADERLLGLGLHTYMSFPMGGERVFGALTLAHPEAIDPPRGLVRWGEILAAHLANVVERMRVEEAVKKSERRYRELAEQLQHANQELESFAYTVSHDLRAPLRTMQGFAHSLLQDFGSQLDPRARDCAKRIIASGQRSEILIRDLLAYSRLSFEEITLQQVDLEAVLRTSLEELDGDLRRVGARVVAETPFSTVLGCQSTLVQVMTNLLSNATKFVKEGRKPEIRIWEEDREGAARLWIEDNGVGIAAHQLSRIFRTFERLEGDVHRPGTGIGLAVVRKGMERLGGTAGVESTLGEGSRFWIEIAGAAKEPPPWG